MRTFERAPVLSNSEGPARCAFAGPENVLERRLLDLPESFAPG